VLLALVGSRREPFWGQKHRSDVLPVTRQNIKALKELENIGSRMDMQTHAGSSSTQPQQRASLATVRHDGFCNRVTLTF